MDLEDRPPRCPLARPEWRRASYSALTRGLVSCCAGTVPMAGETWTRTITSWPTARNNCSEASKEMWGMVSGHEMVVAGERHTHHELLIAGGPIGQRVRLALFSSSAQTRFAPPNGGVLIAGA